MRSKQKIEIFPFNLFQNCQQTEKANIYRYQSQSWTFYNPIERGMIVTVPTMGMIFVTRDYCPYQSHQNWHSPSENVVEAEIGIMNDFSFVYLEKHALQDFRV